MKKTYLFLLILCALNIYAQPAKNISPLPEALADAKAENVRGDFLMTSHWTQDAPYNKMCPRDPVPNSNSYAGCPAVAMGQIINYLHTTQGTRFDDNDDYRHNYAGRNYDIDDDWETIGFPSFPTLNEYLDQADAEFQNGNDVTGDLAAAIVFACGTACTQVYTSQGSGTFRVEQAFEAYKRFGFDDCVLYKDPCDEMYELLIDNLQNGYPAHLAVESPDGQSGHNVVVDGYRESDGKYHMNFGYGGSIDGWYSIPDPNFYYNLTELEGIILNIIPKQQNEIDLYVSSTGFALWDAEGEFLVKLGNHEAVSTENPFFQHDMENLESGMTYTTSVAVVENGVAGPWNSFSWVYDPCERYPGFQNTNISNPDGNVLLEWTLPEGSLPGPDFDPIWIGYDDGVNIANLGGSDIPGGQSANMYWGIKLPASELESYEQGWLTKIALWTNHFTLGPFTADIYQGPTPTNENLVLNMTFLPNIVEQMTEIELSAPIQVGDSDLWIMLSQSGAASPASVCANTGDPNGRFVSTDGVNWVDLASLGLDYTFMVRGYIEPTPSAKHAKEVLFDQAQFVTDEGAMPDNANASNLQQGQVTFGAYANWAMGNGDFYLVADDFTLQGNSTINEVEVFGYQVGSGLESTFDGLYMQIWQGNPNGAGHPVWGDMATNLMTSTSFTNCYRTQYLEGTTRPIMSIVASDLNIDLPAGHYWLVWGMTGDDQLNGPYAQPVAIAGQTNTGNAMQKASDGWLALTDSQCHDPYGLAMKISGVNHGGFLPYEGTALGTLIYRDGEFLAAVEPGDDLYGSYVDENIGFGNHIYEMRVIYDGEIAAAPELSTFFAMSCPEILLSDPTSVNEENVMVSIYPNPSSGHFTIEAEGIKHIEIFNALGQCIKSENVDNELYEVNLESSNAGIYLIRVLTEIGIISKPICIR